MAIVFGNDAGIRQGAFESAASRVVEQFQQVKSGFLNIFGESTGVFPEPPLKQVFVDDGFSNVPGTAFVGSQFSNIDDIKTRRITTQEPSLTVYIKKRVFWSLRNEFDVRFMDTGEKLLMRATKLLFENKCSQLAAYEALTKASSLITEDSEFDAARVEALYDRLNDFFDEAVTSLEADALTAIQTDPTNIEFNERIINQLEELKRDAAKIGPAVESLFKLKNNVKKTRQATHTNWVIDTDANAGDVINIGRGSGVIELTLVSNLSTSLSLDYQNKGSVQFSIQDPYNLTKITSSEIESALSAAFKEVIDIENIPRTGGTAGSFNEQALLGGPSFFLEEARRKEERLNRIRRDKVSNAFGLSGSGTGPIGTAGAPEIVFEVNPTTFAQNKVTISITSLPESFNSPIAFSLALTSLPVEHQLGLEELSLVKEIFDLLTEYVNSVQKLNDTIREINSNPDVEYARRKLRQWYLGKSIIQPMDGIHVYMRGNTFKDGQVVGPLNALLNDSSFIQSFAENSQINDIMLEEEMRLFGIENVPVELYRSIRTGSLLRNAGIHVFGGLVSSTSERYSDGSYVLDVSGESNMKWLDISRANTRPSLDQSRGVLEDPLTAHQIEIDESTGLIKSDPQLLSQNKLRLPLLNYDSGTSKGDKPSENNIKQDNIPISSNSTLPVFQHAPGLVYRWKEGIITATLNINLRTSLDGKGEDSAKLRRELGVNVVENPFASADAADVVSIMVTGWPHNYESFVLNAQSIGTFSFGHNNSSESFFHTFFDVFRSQNKALGDFHPFKTINITQEQMAKRLEIQDGLVKSRKKLQKLRRELAEFQDRMDSISTQPEQLKSLGQISEGFQEEVNVINRQRSEVASSLVRIINDLKKQINQESGKFQQSIKDGAAEGLRIYGNDIAFDFDRSTGASTEEEVGISYKKIKIRNRMLQLRPQLSCKFNSDTNLFIVSDDYDKDLDIQAFALKALNSKIPLWESGYDTPYSICCNVAKTLDFEFFCMAKDTIILVMDSLGNISSKCIEDFIDGDSVLSINQKTKVISWQPAKLHKRRLNKDEKMFAIRDGQGNSIKVSNKHRLLDNNLKEIVADKVVPGTLLGTATNLPNIQQDSKIDIYKIFENHKWYKDLGDKFVIKGKGSRCNPIPKSVIVDEEISWLLGIYIAEGSISDVENRIDKNSRGYYTIFSLNYDELSIAKKISDIISLKFNINSKIYCYKKYNRCTVSVGSFVFAKIIKNIFGRTLSENKKIPPIMWRASNKNKIACLAGIFVGDGTFNRRISISSKSKYLLNDISQILLMLEIPSKIDKYNKIHIYGKNNILQFTNYLKDWKYYKQICDYCSSSNTFENRKKISNYEVKDVKEIIYDDFVYDLGVDNNHTFLIGQTWSHNCDTQGHIHFRPPKYNKTPLSLILKLFLLDRGEGKRIYPVFLEQLFRNRLKTFADEAELKDLEIREQLILLGVDVQIPQQANNVVQDETSTINLNNFMDAATAQLTADEIRNKSKLLIDTRNTITAKRGGTPIPVNAETLASAADDIAKFSVVEGRKNPNVNVNRLSVINKLAQLQSQKQKIDNIKKRLGGEVEKFEGTRKNTLHGQGNRRLTEEEMNNLLAPFEDLVENDLFDDLGPNSSSRFIISDDQIISYEFTESDNEIYCRVDVTGQQDLIGEEGAIGGVPILWAGGTDFDLWRQYGWRSQGAINKPFFTDAELQCAPYALMLLSRNRRNTVRGTITLAGNEYYQLGDVIYLNSRDMLYYVTGVRHSFSYDGNGTFTTSLDLRYGHPLGDYIATPLDVIGKNLIENQRLFNYRITSRETASRASGVSIGTVVFPNSTSEDISAIRKELLIGGFGASNLKALKNALLKAHATIRNEGLSKVEIRGFVRNESDSNRVAIRMGVVEEWLTSPHSIGPGGDIIPLPEKDFKPLTSDDFSVVDPVNVTKPSEEAKAAGRFPREEAFASTLEDGDPTNVIDIVLVVGE